MRARHLLLCCFAVGLVALEAPTFAQGPREDEELAKSLFIQGKEAFEAAEYELALTSFRQSYALSGRGELHYNIGLAADRLRMDAEALSAFKAYLSEVEKPAREAEVKERIRALENSIAERKRLEDEQKKMKQKLEEKPRTVDRQRHIIGPAVLGGAGVVGIGVMTAGLIRKGKCTERDGNNCVERAKINPVGGIIYGGAGGAAVLGAILWYGLSGKKSMEKPDPAKPSTEVGLLLDTPGLSVHGTF